MVSLFVTVLRLLEYLTNSETQDIDEDPDIPQEVPTENDRDTPQERGMRGGSRKRRMDTGGSSTSVGDGQYNGKGRGSKSPRTSSDQQRGATRNKGATTTTTPLFSGDVVKQKSHVCTVHLQDWIKSNGRQLRNHSSRTEFRFLCGLGDVWQENPYHSSSRRREPISTGDDFTDKILSNLEMQGYTLQEKLGEGKFGSVLLAFSHLRSRQVALKFLLRSGGKKRTVRKNGSTSNPRIIDTPDEISLHSRLKHQNIVEMLDYNMLNERVSLVLEYCDNGTLDHLLKARPGGFLTEPVSKRYFHQMLAALGYIHYMKIAHRDIKCPNFVINCKDRIKLCDFGSAHSFASDVPRVSGKCGSSGYQAPEVLEEMEYDPFKADIWSLGVVLFIMLTSKFPYGHEVLDDNSFSSDMVPIRPTSSSAIYSRRLSRKRSQRRLGEQQHPSDTADDASSSQSPSSSPFLDGLWELRNRERVRPFSADPKQTSVPTEKSEPHLSAMYRGPDFSAVQSVRITDEAKELLMGMLQSVTPQRFSINRVKHTDWYKDVTETPFIGNCYLVRQPRKIAEGQREMELKASWDL